MRAVIFLLAFLFLFFLFPPAVSENKNNAAKNKRNKRRKKKEIFIAAFILFSRIFDQWRAVLFIAAVFILRHLLFSAAIILCLFISAR